MKRRELKKSITLLCSDLFAECVALLHYKTNVNPAEVDKLMIDILRMQNELITRISHVEPGNTKAFFRKLRQDLTEEVDRKVEQIKSLA